MGGPTSSIRYRQHSSQDRVTTQASPLRQSRDTGGTHSCSKHVEDSNKHVIEEIVRQVGYLPELYVIECVRKVAVHCTPPDFNP